MGFWDTLGKVGKDMAKEALQQGKDAMERSKQYQAEMTSKSDDELFRIVKTERTRSFLKASAAYHELKNRGYSAEDMKART